MNIYRRRAKNGGLVSPNYYYRFTNEGRAYSGSTSTADAALARKILSKKHTMVVEGRQLDIKKPRQSPTFKEAAQSYLEGEGKAKKSKATDVSILERSLKPFFGKKRLHQIRREDVVRWLNARRESSKPYADRPKPRPATIQNEFALLRRILNVAVQADIIERNPLQGIKLGRPNNRRERVISEGELKQLLSKIEGRNNHLRPIILLACETGMRAGEIRTLLWNQVEFRGSEGFVQLEDTKNGDRRRVPLNQLAMEELRAWDKGHPRNISGYVFPVGHQGQAMRLTSLTQAWRRLVSEAGIPDAHFHDLRHTFITRRVEAGTDILTLAEITGHRDLKMLRRYYHASDEAKLAAVRA